MFTPTSPRVLRDFPLLCVLSLITVTIWSLIFFICQNILYLVAWRFLRTELRRVILTPWLVNLNVYFKHIKDFLEGLEKNMFLGQICLKPDVIFLFSEIRRQMGDIKWYKKPFFIRMFSMGWLCLVLSNKEFILPTNLCLDRQKTINVK